jgi:tetratricopeptide (TPR) repeat protein
MFTVRDNLEKWSAEARTSRTDTPLGKIEDHVERAERKALLVEVEGTIAPDLIAELMLRSPSSRREVVRGSRRYKLLGLSEALREESRREARRDVARALELAELAAEVADCLSTRYYGPRLVADSRALAWAMVGNSHRVAGEYFAAERAFRTASDLLERGTGNPTEISEVQVLLASLRIEQAQFNIAIRLLEEAAATYRQLGLRQQEAKAIFKMGNAAILAGEPERSLELFDACLDLLDTEDNPKMVLLAHHNIATALNDSGAAEEAHAYLESLSSQYDEYPEDRTIQIQRQWLEGLILAGIGRTDESIDKLTRIRRLFVEEDQAYDTAQVTLDLSGILLAAGETNEVKRLVQEMYPIFRSQDVHRQAIAALVLFEQAVTQEAATVALARDVGRYLARARNNPYLRFEPAGSRVD